MTVEGARAVEMVVETAGGAKAGARATGVAVEAETAAEQMAEVGLEEGGAAPVADRKVSPEGTQEMAGVDWVMVEVGLVMEGGREREEVDWVTVGVGWETVEAATGWGVEGKATGKSVGVTGEEEAPMVAMVAGMEEDEGGI